MPKMYVVLRQGDISGFRAVQMIQNKAQSAGKGPPLCKGCNAVVEDHLHGSLRAGRETLVRGVATLGKGRAIAGPARLADERFTTR